MKVQLRKMFVIALLATSFTHQSNVNRCIKKAIFQMTPHGSHHPTRIFVNNQAFIEIGGRGGFGPENFHIELDPVSNLPRSRHRRIKRSRRVKRIQRRQKLLRKFSSRVADLRTHTLKTVKKLTLEAKMERGGEY